MAFMHDLIMFEPHHVKFIFVNLIHCQNDFLALTHIWHFDTFLTFLDVTYYLTNSACYIDVCLER